MGLRIGDGMYFSNKDCERCSEEDRKSAPYSTATVLSALVALIALVTAWVFVLTTPRFAWGIHFLEAVSVIGLAGTSYCVHGFIQRNVKGRMFWLFRGPDKRIHLHRKYPRGESDLGYGSLYVCFRYGGRKRYSFIATKEPGGDVKHPEWTVMCKDGYAVLDSKGTKLECKSLEDLLIVVQTGSNHGFNDMVSLFSGLSYMNGLFVDAHEQTKEAKADAEQAIAQRDLLGVEMMKLIALMRRSADTMGKSKHAQLVRVRIEEMTRNFPTNIQVMWRARADAELQAERKRRDPPEPLSS